MSQPVSLGFSDWNEKKKLDCMAWCSEVKVLRLQFWHSYHWLIRLHGGK